MPEPAPKKEYLPPEYYKGTSTAKKVVLYGLIAILIIALGAGGYWFGFHKNKKQTQTPSAAQSTTSSQQQSDNTASAATKHYDSANFNLGIDYPADWMLSDNGGGKMTVTSPSLSLKSANGQPVNAREILTITPKGQNLGAFDAGSATAVMDSEKVAYTKPTQTQRGNTYLSFLQYSKTTTTGALDGVYITGDAGYQKGQDIPKSDIANVDPEIVLSFSGADGQPLSIAASNWDVDTFSGPIKKMLTSLSIN